MYFVAPTDPLLKSKFLVSTCPFGERMDVFSIYDLLIFTWFEPRDILCAENNLLSRFVISILLLVTRFLHRETEVHGCNLYLG